MGASGGKASGPGIARPPGWAGELGLRERATDRGAGMLGGMITVLAIGLLALNPDDALLTRAERSGFRETSRHAEVVDLLDALAASSELAQRATMGRTGEGREIPLLVVADPPVASGAEARAAAAAGRLVVLAFGNIHAGEVCGKEALPILARELLGGGQRDVLAGVVFIIAPIYNGDGNERFSPDHRRTQNGPPEVGTRENAAGLDLNRDFVKVEAPETAVLVRFMNEWDPHIVIDTHATNGSPHRFLMTYAGPKAPAGDVGLIGWTRRELFPALDRRYEARTGERLFWYGSFGGAFGGPRDRGRWETFPAEARYGTTYIGLRNRIGILSEAYAYAPFEERVRGTRDFVATILEYAAEHRAAIAGQTRGADERTIAKGLAPGDAVAIRSRAVPREGRFTILGFEEEDRDGRSVATDRHAEYEVELIDEFIAERTVTRPWAYVFPGELAAIGAKLEQHGIKVERLTREATLDVETYTIEGATPASRVFQGHVLVRADARASRGERRFVAGDYLVWTAQALGNLVVYLLEPECEDGLATWNYFDAYLKPGSEFPVHRVMSAAGLP